MQHLGTRTLRTDRLILRPFTVEDAPAMYANWAGDPEVTRYLTWPTHQSEAVTRAVLTDWTAHYGQGDWYLWAIAPAGDAAAPIGSISVVRQDARIGLAEVGYCIGRAWWRQGVMSEALEAVLDFLIRQVGCNRVQARHDPRNPNSGRVMRRCGMQYEGTLRQADWNNQGVCDEAVYGILAAEYHPPANR